MKKTFKLEHPKIKMPRVVDSIKHEIKKYLKRERGKALPAGAKYWGFDCKIGLTEEAAVEVEVSLINKSIDELIENKAMSFYVEVMAKPLEAFEGKPTQEN